MINLALLRPDLSTGKMDSNYFKKFNMALINWELNRQEDRQILPKKVRKTSK
jgi:hypothetical protein